MHDLDFWTAQGFQLDTSFKGEYDLWINPKTLQYVRLYVSGQVWLKSLTTGQYELVEDKTNGN
jgi:hypothetical protein